MATLKPRRKPRPVRRILAPKKRNLVFLVWPRVMAVRRPVYVLSCSSPKCSAHLGLYVSSVVASGVPECPFCNNGKTEVIERVGRNGWFAFDLDDLKTYSNEQHLVPMIGPYREEYEAICTLSEELGLLSMRFGLT